MTEEEFETGVLASGRSAVVRWTLNMWRLTLGRTAAAR